MGKKAKNLSQEDLEDVAIYEAISEKKTNNTISLNDIPIKVKCLNEKQKELKKIIEEKDISIVSGPAGCLIKTEKVKIYRLK
jgi:hypothetical protein